MNFSKWHTWVKELREKRQAIRVMRQLAGKTGQRTKEQHYVPQCYLKNFSHDRKAVWVFDKRVGKSYRSTVRDIGHKNHFYDLHFDVTDKPEQAFFNQVQLAEAALAEIDAGFAKCLEELLAVKASEGFSDDLRQGAIFYLGIQKLRRRCLAMSILSCLPVIFELALCQNTTASFTCSSCSTNNFGKVLPKQWRTISAS